MNFVVLYVQYTYVGNTACHVAISDQLSILASFQ